MNASTRPSVLPIAAVVATWVITAACLAATLFLDVRFAGAGRADLQQVLDAKVVFGVSIVSTTIVGSALVVRQPHHPVGPGDEVFGDPSARGFGTFAGSVSALESAMAPKPVNPSFGDAATVPVAAVTTMQGLRDKGQIRPGQKVLINGASGGVGTFAVQIAKPFETDVTAVCGTRNVDPARSIEADHVVDDAREDVTQNGQQFDLMLAANGYRRILAYGRALSSRGTDVMTGVPLRK